MKKKKIGNFLENNFTKKYRNSVTGNLKIEIPCTFSKLKKENKKLIFYSIAYNNSIDFTNPYFTDQNAPSPMSKISIAVKKNLDEAIFNKFKDKKIYKGNFDYGLEYQPYPKFGLKFKRSRSFVANIGSFFFSLSTTVRKNSKI